MSYTTPIGKWVQHLLTAPCQPTAKLGTVGRQLAKTSPEFLVTSCRWVAGILAPSANIIPPWQMGLPGLMGYHRYVLALVLYKTMKCWMSSRNR